MSSDPRNAARLLLGLPSVEDEEQDGKATFRERLIRFFEIGDLYHQYPFPETVPGRGLYFRGRFEFPADLRINLQCPTCADARRTFAILNDGENRRSDSVDVLADKTGLLPFECTYCQEQRCAFLVHVGKTEETAEWYLIKAGVWPSARPAPSAELAKGLGAAKELFIRGLTAQKFGFGIGAYAYYRRVTEDIIERLLADLRQYAEEAGDTELVKAIDETASETQASKQIAVVKDLVPKVLRPGGMNPLGALYDALSDGLHGRTDDECLERAEALRVTIEFLVTRLESLVTTPKQYVEAMKKLKAPPKGARPPKPEK